MDLCFDIMQRFFKSVEMSQLISTDVATLVSCDLSGK